MTDGPMGAWWGICDLVLLSNGETTGRCTRALRDRADLESSRWHSTTLSSQQTGAQSTKPTISFENTSEKDLDSLEKTIASAAATTTANREDLSMQNLPKDR